MIDVTITLHGVDGSAWTLYGPGAGQQGAHLAAGGLGAFYDAPIAAEYDQVARQRGSTFRSARYLHRDIIIKVHLLGASANEWEQVDAQWLRAFSPVDEAMITVQTPVSPRRWIKVRLAEAPVSVMDIDPHINQAGTVSMVLRAAFPFYQTTETLTSTWVFDGINWHSQVQVSNPGDVPVWPRWVCTAPARFILPDVSFRSGADASRQVILPYQPVGTDVLIDTDPLEETIATTDGTLLWAQLRGQSFIHPIPASTPPTMVPIGVDPLPLIPVVIPDEWKVWIATKLKELAASMGAEAFVSLTVDQIAEKISSIITSSTPPGLTALAPEVLGQLVPNLIGKALATAYGSVANVAGATAQVRIDPLYLRPWGGGL